MKSLIILVISCTFVAVQMEESAGPSDVLKDLLECLPTEPGETVSDIDHLINNIDSADMEDIVSCLAEKVKNLLQTEKVTGILAVLSKTAPSLLEILLPLLFADSEPTAPEWLSETTIDGIHNEEL